MERGHLAEFGKNASHIMIFRQHYLWAENNNAAIDHAAVTQ